MKKITRYISHVSLILIITGSSIKAQPKAGYHLPEYQKFQLANGLTVYLMEKHDVPVISINIALPAAAVNDGDKAGLASLTAKCLKCGTSTYTKNEIEKQFDFVGATLYLYSETEIAGIAARFAVKDQEKILPLVKEVLVNPDFPEEEFVKERKRTLLSIDQAKESPGSVINSYWNKFYFGSNAYGNVVPGTVSSVKSLTAEDAKIFYKKYYHPEGAVIAAVGDFTSSQMKAALTKLFGDWKNSGSSPGKQAPATVTPPSSSRVLLVNKDDAHETTFIIGSAGVSRNNPDYIPLEVVNTLFGGKYTSWLNSELRIKSGLTYGARSYFDYSKDHGSFIISTHTANETTKPSIDKTLEVINRLHSQPVDEETLTSAKNYMIGMLPPGFQSANQLAVLLTNMFWYEYDESYINNFEANVNAVTVSKVKQVIAKYFPKDKLQFVLIGKSADIKKIAEKYGPVKEVSIKDDIGKGF